MKKLFLLTLALISVLILSACAEEHEHTLVQLPALEPTCTEDGHYSYEECEECRYTTFESIPAFGHSIIYEDKKAASCEIDGVAAHYLCDECNRLFADEEGITALSPESLILPKTGHKDENHDYFCENRCGIILLTEDVLNALLSDTLALSDVTVRDHYFSEASNTYYYIFDDHIRIVYDNGNDEYIYKGDDESGTFNVGSVLSEKYNLAYASDIEITVCPIKEFEGRQLFTYKNTDGLKVGIVINENGTLLDGILIYDENNNIIHEIMITPEIKNEIA